MYDMYLNFLTMYLPVPSYGKNTVFEILCHFVVVNHMVRHMLEMMRLVSMRTCFSIWGKYVTPIKFRVISGISTVFSYIGQCDLLNTCCGLLHVWYTPGGSMCRICHLTSKESIFTLIRSY